MNDGCVILVLDDHYAVESEDFYSRKDFERDFGALPFLFVFSPAWDDGARQYTVEAALRAVSSTKPQGILLDVMFGSNRTDRLGVDILRQLTLKHLEIPVVMMTSVARDELWAECARLGAVDYLVKPMSDRLLAQTLHRYAGVEMKHWLIGQNKHFLAALNLAAMAAEGKRTPVMITGETGSGKELVAGFVHRHGRGENTPFKVIYLSTITPDLQAGTTKGHPFCFCLSRPKIKVGVLLLSHPCETFVGPVIEGRLDLLLPVSAIMILMECLEPHPATFAHNNSTARLGKAYRIFPWNAFQLFPLHPLIFEHFVPSETLDLLECLDALFDFRGIQAKQFILESRVVQVEQYFVIISAHEADSNPASISSRFDSLAGLLRIQSSAFANLPFMAGSCSQRSFTCTTTECFSKISPPGRFSMTKPKPANAFPREI